MYTKARIAGHPIHPMLVAFPIGLYGATIAALLAFLGTHDAFYFRAAMTANIAGVVMAGLTAIPGVIDLMSLPRHSQARSVGWQHAGFNVASLLLFVISAAMLYGRWSDRTSVELDATLPLAVGMIGLVTTVIAGSLGWAMVQTHHVGVKPRFDESRRPARPVVADAVPLAHRITGRYNVQSHVHH